VSQWEREAIGERTRDALHHMRSNGQRIGNIAYGYRLAADGRHLEPEPHEQAVIAKIRNLRDRRRTLRTIAADLNSHGPAHAPRYGVAARTCRANTGLARPDQAAFPSRPTRLKPEFR
jgi:hypothetical protein